MAPKRGALTAITPERDAPTATTRDRDALITGIGLVSSLGCGVAAHWQALRDVRPLLDTESFAPFAVHKMAALELDAQIPKRGDQRQMEPWQRLGVFAAGLALDEASVTGNTELLSRMGMIVAAGGGERDYAVDTAILSGYRQAADQGAYLNQHLQSDLRPTLFLAQLSNMLAGNISIVHGVIGSSRTFMGEEPAGADAVRTACARIAAGQADIMLVGGSYNALRPDIILQYQFGKLLRRAPFDPVWARQSSGGGMVLGSASCFLVIESRAHAAKRGAAAYARVAAVRTDRCRRGAGDATLNARAQLDSIADVHGTSGAAVISGASGVAAPTLEEQRFLAEVGLPVRATATAFGHTMEPSFPLNLALAAMSVRHGALFPPLEAAEAPMQGSLRQVLVTSWGHWRGEALAVVTPA